ncbi:MAG TPA: sugar phosphate isomerase/epimerase [Patescibacteria group bacterium]|nr:sugar phosphate isomerase/epimerase [Patescibacteria group bacterium]
MKIHASITDFPLLSHLEEFFKNFSNAGVEGVEIVLGVKSRWKIQKLKYFSKKYKLPIASLHQPAWSGVGLYFDEEIGEIAQELGVKYMVFHPLAFHSFDSRAMKNYFQRLSKIQEKYGIHVMLENMPNDIAYKKLHQFPQKNTLIPHMEKISEIADEYGLLLTYDVSHAELKKPQNEKIFQDMFSHIGNIHMSSFNKNQHHLPLSMGDLDSKGFLTYLKNKKYNGLLTLEVYYPKLGLVLDRYDFSAIEDSVKIAKEILGK